MKSKRLLLTLEKIAFRIADLIKPAERISVSEAATRHRFLNNTASYVGMWPNEKTPYLVEPMDVLTSRDFIGMVLCAPARTGKALALDTPIKTRDGWSTMGEMAVGDAVFDETGATCNVVAVTEVMANRRCYKVTFSDHETIVADADHQWEVLDAHRPDRYRVMTTEELHPNHKYGANNRNRYSVDVTLPLLYGHKEVHLDPYILGAWLGDGHNIGARLSSGALDVDNMVANINACGVKTRIGPDNNGNFVIYLSEKRHTPGRRGGAAGVSANLRYYGMGMSGTKKHIPYVYLTGSIEQRFDLLQGLMDTDGHVDHRGQCEFCTTSPELAEGFSELLSSLGYKYCLIKRPAASKTAHRFIFYVRKGDVLFRLHRKQSRLDISRRRATLKNSRRSIISIERCPSVPVRCIQVDSPSRLYLAGRKMVPTHNSDIFFNWMCHTALYDPLDMMFVAMTQAVARDWSQTPLERFLRASKEVGAKVLKKNVHDVKFTNGWNLLVKWPSVSELSGKTIGRGWFADYDRMVENVDGEGGAFDLGQKRGQTFKNLSMWVAESSPGRDVTDPRARLVGHQAPPTTGILELYNRGDRRRWYWKCQNCQEAFEATFETLNYPENEPDISQAARMVTCKCPHCEWDHEPSEKYNLNLNGRWIKDGMKWNKDGTITGTPIKSKIASFWMFGPSAAFQSWEELVEKYLTAKRAYENTGDTEPLKTTTNTDQGAPFVPPSVKESRTPEWLAKRKRDWGGTKENPVVPEEVRFLIATVDVQAGSRSGYVVQVHGVDEHMNISFVDMFQLKKSKRKNDEGEYEQLDPSGYLEDWDVLIDGVILKTYPLASDPKFHMQIKLVGCDSGGKAGVTTRAYDFWRRLRDNADDSLPHGIVSRFQLIRGEPSKSAPTVKISMPESSRKDRNAMARGEIPLAFMNSLLLKDQIDGMLNKTEGTGGFISFPHWAPAWLYKQLTGERRTEKGWENIGQGKNEAWDLLYYCVGLLRSSLINFADIKWDRPPDWAKPQETNSLVFEFSPEISKEVFEKKKKRTYDMAALAREYA